MTNPKDDNFDANAGDAAPNQDAEEQSSRRKRLGNKVVNYAKADPELKAKMETIMKPIDLNPDSFNAILDYGNAPLQELGKAAAAMIQVQVKFNDQVNVMSSAMSNLQQGFTKMDLKSMGEAAKKLLSNAAATGAKAGKGIFKGAKDAWEGLSGAKARRDEDQKLVDEMGTKLPEMMSTMFKLIKEVERADENIDKVMEEAKKLGIARLEAMRELNVYLGTREEVLRRYDEEYIPEAQKDIDEAISAGEEVDADDQVYLDDLLKRRQDFVDRMLTLEGSRAACMLAQQQLKQIIETLEEQRKQVQEFKHNGQHEWIAAMAAAGFAGSALKVAQMNKKAGEFSGQMLDVTTDMMERAHGMMLEQKGRGVHDPAKLIEHLGRMEKMIEAGHQAQENRMRQIEALGQQLRGATDRVLDAAADSEAKLRLEAVEQAKARADAANDDKQQPDAAAPKKPRRAGGTKDNGPDV